MAVERVGSFDEIADEFAARVAKVVWCNLATVDARGRPRSRVVHPVWVGRQGWLGVRRGTPKTRQVDANPHVSLAYVSDLAKPFYVESTASWVEDPSERQRYFETARSLPPPLGFDPAPIFGAPDDPGFGLLAFTPWRIQLDDMPTRKVVWLAAAERSGA